MKPAQPAKQTAPEAKPRANQPTVEPVARRPRGLLARIASRVLCAPILSPIGLVVRAMPIALAFAVVHALGWREHTTFLSGTPASAAGGTQQSAVFGITYIAVYLACVLLCPIMGIAAGLLALISEYTRRKDGARP